MDSMISTVFLVLLAGLVLAWVLDGIKRKSAQPKPRPFELKPEQKPQPSVQPVNSAKLASQRQEPVQPSREVEPVVAPEVPEVEPTSGTDQEGAVQEKAAPEVIEAPVEEPAVTEESREEPKAEAEVLQPEIEPKAEAVEEVPAKEVEETPASKETEEEKKAGWFARVRSGLGKTRSQLTDNLVNLFAGAKTIDDDLLEEIETLLLTADVGIEATTQIIGSITEKLARKELKDAEALKVALKAELAALLEPCTSELMLEEKSPYVILVVGVNGVGKTTTIGKLAKRFQQQGKSVMLAAGDTFRAAAVEQLQVWGERNNVPVVAQHTGADSASVIFDAIQAAKSREVDIIIADTAGRLQNKDNLMAELEKVVRVIKKHDEAAPHEVLLVLDAGTGQNALSQAQLFRQAVGVSGIAVTKLDGTAKGGILFAIAKQHQLPIRFIGVGEGIDDLRPFEANEFVNALFDA
ncbi:signal recognition particle-docking protein FtsY [Hahella sp. CCB-MM4]|uniref:signal recognition particle-docking protein FtsY n=1 Tax=Hahella sp. (strain CCB-MM4) TaxID=1926491 RepID=UPI000B9BC480|nr:signal recognition particle-docking protein FtsY [Hahella sp. CCB-MM4]OZG75129.1 signal recognition particle-docking protein FtsY [Hahella sp. CCB-MM4]